MKPDFSKDDSFFDKSETLKKIRQDIIAKNHRNPEETIFNLSMKLWAESVIKHNLDINMTKIDSLYLLSNENSKDVINFFGTIMFKPKDKRKLAEFELLREQEIAESNIKYVCLMNREEDYYYDLKKEYEQYVSNPTPIKRKSKKV